MYLSVIIPAYNEAKRIGKTLEAIGTYLRTQTYEWEVIVVNNNSSDETAAFVAGFVNREPRIKLLNENGPGKGHAVMKGMLSATGDYRVFTDADNSTSIEHVEKMWPFIQNGYDVVIGSLAVPGARVAQGEPWYRVVMGKLGNKWIQFFAVWGIHDTQRGFKMFTARAAQAIFPKLTIFGWGFDIEVLALARKYNFKIKEIPVTWSNDPNSKVNIWAYPQVLMQTLTVRWNLLTNKYGQRI
ncbi:MAG: dolichyl-phosphate beta-glucosyltransferase [Patescibacteria group bacterium]